LKEGTKWGEEVGVRIKEEINYSGKSKSKAHRTVRMKGEKKWHQDGYRHVLEANTIKKRWNGVSLEGGDSS